MHTNYTYILVCVHACLSVGVTLGTYVFCKCANDVEAD